MKTPYFIEKIDWSELRNQKKALIEVMNTVTTVEQSQYLEGILCLIDAVQDYAVDEMGLNPNDIYDIEANDETPEQRFAREQAESIYLMHVEGSFIYENEEMSKEFIKSIFDDEQHTTAIKNIMRLAILKDIEIGIIKTLKYNIEMYDYGYMIEDYCLEQYYKNKTKSVGVCTNCGSDNVQIKMWVGLNDNVIGDLTSDGEDEDNYCKDCCDNHTIDLITKPYLSNVIGFQVVADNNNIHPEMDNSFSVYNLSQAREMLNNIEEHGDTWKLLTIWSGDIEKPIMMFEGNPRD